MEKWVIMENTGNNENADIGNTHNHRKRAVIMENAGNHGKHG